MGCGAAEATGLGFVCFIIINPCELSCSGADFGHFCLPLTLRTWSFRRRSALLQNPRPWGIWSGSWRPLEDCLRLSAAVCSYPHRLASWGEGGGAVTFSILWCIERVCVYVWVLVSTYCNTIVGFLCLFHHIIICVYGCLFFIHIFEWRSGCFCWYFD